MVCLKTQSTIEFYALCTCCPSLASYMWGTKNTWAEGMFTICISIEEALCVFQTCQVCLKLVPRAGWTPPKFLIPSNPIRGVRRS